MSATTQPVSSAAPPQLREATFDDFPAISRLESQLVRQSFEPDDRRKLFENNPLWPRLAQQWPVGWVLEDADGTLVGTLTNVPAAYVFRGQEKICAVGIAWAVTAEHRGYAILLMDEYFHQEGADIVLTPSVGDDATAIWQAYGHEVPLGDWQRAAYVVPHHRSFARATLARKKVPAPGALSVPAAAALAVKEKLTTRPLPRTPDDVEIRESPGFDDRFDAFWEELRAQQHDTLLAVRDRATLEWHYRLPLRSGQLSVFTAHRNGAMRAFCVTKRYLRPGRMRCMKIVDYQSVDTTFDLLPGLVRAASARCTDEGIGLLEHTGCDIPKMQTFDRFAPYRLTKAVWPYWFRTSDPALATALADPGVWDPSEYDGDATYM